MANEAQVAHLDDAKPARANEPSHAAASSARLGLVCAPDLPEKIGRELADELPKLHSQHVDNRVAWDVSVVVDPLTGSERNAPEILDVCRERMLKEGWDLAVCLTDLPVYRGGHLIVGDASAARKVAGLSLPALGATRLLTQARQAVLQLVEELYARISELGKDAPPPSGEERKTKAPSLSGQRPNRLVRRRPLELVAPFRRVEPPDDDMREMNVDARFVAPKSHGHLRLLSGMVLANRPWKLIPSFRSALAGAFATGAYALVTPTIWQLADVMGAGRHIMLMLAAIIAMVVWIIIAHGLWERRDDQEARKWTRLYNGVTALTITVAVLLSYVVLFVVILLTAAVLVPGGYFQTNVSHPVDFNDYLILGWMASSLATVAGALGSSLDDEDSVRKAAFGYRQQRRSKRAEDASEDDSAAA